MTRAEITGIAPFLIVRDVPTSMAFYRDKLGFEITFEGPEPNDIFFGIVERGGAFILMMAVGAVAVCGRSGGGLSRAAPCIASVC